MGFENLKRWHWIVVGLIVGLVIAYVRTEMEPTYPKSLSPQEFENQLGQSHEVTSNGNTIERPWLKSIVIHPAIDGVYQKKVQIVTLMKDTYVQKRAEDKEKGIAAQEAGWKYEQYGVKVELPFNPNGATTYGGSFRKYMEDAAKNDEKVKYNYAWWEEPVPSYSMWTAGCAVVIGGVWPSVINVLIGAGFARPKKTEKDYDLERFGKYKEEQAKAAPKVMSAEEQEQLARVTANLEKELAPSGNGMRVGVGAGQPTEQPVKKLDGKQLEIANIEKEDEDKEYKGEYYPVARPVHQHHDGPAEEQKG